MWRICLILLKVPSASTRSTFGLDRDSVINQYITTLLLLQEDEDCAGDVSTDQEEMQPLSHADALERVLQVIPMLHSTSELTDSLCAAMLKVCAQGHMSMRRFFSLCQFPVKPRRYHGSL